MNKKLSIIVPVYNVEKYIRTCIDSLLDQDYSNYEIILVDDGSTDNSKKICKEYEKKYPGLIKVYAKKNGGQASARNYALKKIETDYVFFVDSDDYIKSNCLKYLMRKVKGQDILVFNQIEVTENLKTESIINTYDDSIIDIQKRYIVSMPGPCNKIINANLLKENKILFPVKMIYEDLAIIPTLGIYTDKIVYDEGAYYYYIQRHGSTMHQKKYNAKLEDIFLAIDILDSGFNGKYKEELEYIYILHLLKNASLRFLDFNKNDMLEKINTVMKNKFPNWIRNSYFKKYDFKRRIMCRLLFAQQYGLIKLLRGKGSV